MVLDPSPPPLPHMPLNMSLRYIISDSANWQIFSSPVTPTPLAAHVLRNMLKMYANVQTRWWLFFSSHIFFSSPIFPSLAAHSLENMMQVNGWDYNSDEALAEYKRRKSCVCVCVRHSCVWHDSFVFMAGHIRMCDMTHLYLWRDTFVCVTWLICIYDGTHSYVWHDASVRGTWFVCMCNMKHDSFVCVVWLVTQMRRLLNISVNSYLMHHIWIHIWCITYEFIFDASHMNSYLMYHIWIHIWSIEYQVTCTHIESIIDQTWIHMCRVTHSYTHQFFTCGSWRASDVCLFTLHPSHVPSKINSDITQNSNA